MRTMFLMTSLCLILTIICIQKADAGAVTAPLKLVQNMVMGMQIPGLSQNPNNSMSCPCNTQPTPVAVIVAKELSVASYAFFVIPGLLPGIWPIVSVTITYLPGVRVYLTVNQIIGYLFHAKKFYLLSVIGCPYLLALKNCPDPVSGTTLKQSDFFAASKIYLQKYPDSCNVIPSTVSVIVPSSAATGRVGTFELDSLSSAFVASRNGQSISSITSDIKKMNYNVNVQSISSGVFIQQPKRTLAISCASESAESSKLGLKVGDTRQKQVDAGARPAIYSAVLELAGKPVSGSMFTKLLLVSDSVYVLLESFTTSGSLRNLYRSFYKAV